MPLALHMLSSKAEVNSPPLSDVSRRGGPMRHTRFSSALHGKKVCPVGKKLDQLDVNKLLLLILNP